MTDYRPIDCGLHSRFELAVLRGEPVRLSWVEPGSACARLASVRPVDLVTRDGEEYLVIETSGRRREIRLDRILGGSVAAAGGG